MTKQRNRKLVVILLLLLVLSGCGDPSTSAEDLSSSSSSTVVGGSALFTEDELGSGGDSSGALVGTETISMLEKAEDKANLMNGFIIGQANNLMTIPGINSLQNLVFGNPYKTWGFGVDESDKLISGIFFQSELTNVIHPLIATFSGVYATLLMGAIMISSLKMGLRAHSPQSKEDFWKDIHMYVASAFFMGLFWMLFQVLMGANWGIVQGVAGTLKTLGKPLDGISVIASATNDGTYSFKMGDLFVFLAEWGLAAYLNFIYIARKIIIVLLCVMSPFAAYSLLFAKTRSFFGTYIKELAGNIFLPSIHAIILFVFVQMAGNLGSGIGPMIFKLGMIIMFVPITGMVSKWLNLGDSSSTVGKAGTAIGLAGIGGAMMLSRGIMNMSGKGKVGSNGGSSGSGTETPGGSEVPMANDSGASSLTRAAEGGSAWNKVKKAGSIGGAIAGGTFGLAFGGGGVAAGALIGSKAMTGVLQGTRNAASGVAGFGKTIRDSARGIGEDGSPTGKMSLSNLTNKWGDLAERRQMMGNLGESAGKVGGAVGAGVGTLIAGPVGAAIGGALGNKMGTMGKSMGQMMSGVSRQRAFESGSGMRSDGTMSPRGMGMETIASDPRYSGSEARWNQTNDRSWYEVKDNASGNWDRIGGYGSGDGSLLSGQRRMIDYDVRNPSKDGEWTRQENGSYNRTINHPAMSDGSGRIQDKARTERQLAGMSGSTADFGRKSEAYIADTSGSKIHSDSSFDMRRVNPAEYFSHSKMGKQVGDNGQATSDMRSGSDKVADFVGVSAPKMTKAATKSYMKGAEQVGWALSGVYNNSDRKSDVI